MRLVALGVSYERMGKTLGFAKSALCKWLKQKQCKRPAVWRCTGVRRCVDACSEREGEVEGSAG